MAGSEVRRLENLIKHDEETLARTERRFQAAIDKITDRMRERRARLEQVKDVQDA